VVMFFPPVPQPSVSEGLKVLKRPPTAPCEEGVLTPMGPAFISRAKDLIFSSSFEKTLTVCPIPPW